MTGNPMTKMNRRIFLRTAVTAAAAAATGSSLAFQANKRMGLTIWSYQLRWRQKEKAGWENALDVLDHCRDLGAGCLQIGVQGWSSDFAGQVRERREALDIGLEGQIGLPRKDGDLERFESELKAGKEAGATIYRTVCLGGRRYETFKTLESWKRFVSESREALERVEPVLAEHRVKLAVENHKDWRIEEFLDLLKHLDSEWIGVNLDFGNNLSLLEHPHAVAEALSPYVMTTHVKDMGLAGYNDGFLLSEVPLGEGVLDMGLIMEHCRKANPDVEFNLEMITRNPLKVPVFLDRYWETMADLPARELAATLKLAKAGDAGALPSMEGRDGEGQLAFEEANVRKSFEFARQKLGFS